MQRATNVQDQDPAGQAADNADDDAGPYTLDQLDDPAKERARDAWREHDLDYNWWDATYADAVTVGRLIGIEIGTRHGRGVYGKPYTELDICFGLYTQGAGACWSGTLHVKELNGAPARLAQEVGSGDTLLHDLAADGQALYNAILLRAFTRRLLGPDPDNQWGDLAEIALDEAIAVTGNDHYYATEVAAEVFPEELTPALNAYVAGFATWLHAQLEAEYDYLSSDEVVDERIRESGLLFNGFGSTI